MTLALGAGLLAASATSASAANITRIDPTDWYVGMKDPSLQLMVYGKNIKDIKSVTTDYPGVKVDSIVRLDSPNYLLVYLNLDGAKAGQMTLNFDGKKIRYTLKNRTMRAEDHCGFSNADVLYLLMPDRFANGNPNRSASPHCGSRPSWRTTGPTTTASTAPITATPPPTTIRSTPASAPTPNIRRSSKLATSAG